MVILGLVPVKFVVYMMVAALVTYFWGVTLVWLIERRFEG